MMSTILRALRFLAARLNERSTYTVALPALFTLVGINMAPDQVATIASVGSTAGLLLTAIVADGKIVSTEKPE